MLPEMIYIPKQTQITRKFNLKEFAVSDTRPDLADRIEFTQLEYRNIELLCLMFLQPTRDVVGRIDILSGKRSPELNAAIGGAEDSDHLRAWAVDVTTPDVRKLGQIYKDWSKHSNCIGQMIIYVGETPDWRPRFIHLSLPSVKHWGELMVDVKGEGLRMYNPQEDEFRLMNLLQ